MFNKTKLCIISVLIILLLSGGCDFWKSKNTNVPTFHTSKNISTAIKKIDENTKEIKKTTKNIKESAEDIKNNIVKIDDKIDDNVKQEIDAHLKSITNGSSSIIANVGTINNNLNNISSSTSEIKESNKQIGELENLVVKLEKERDDAIKDKEELENKSQEKLNTMLIYLIGASIVACAGFAILFVFSGNKMGILGCGISVLVLIIATTLKVYFLWVAIAGGVMLLLFMAFMAYNILTKNKAFKELVSGFEITKSKLSPDQKEELFGGTGDGNIGKIGEAQSPATVEMIKRERNKIKKE